MAVATRRSPRRRGRDCRSCCGWRPSWTVDRLVVPPTRAAAAGAGVASAATADAKASYQDHVWDQKTARRPGQRPTLSGAAGDPARGLDPSLRVCTPSAMDPSPFTRLPCPP
ncbi:hypothetical protein CAUPRSCDRAFT_11733 [Caulochytrium protostelioides]|uniref:Uncharacterized protein n=1 Tax=Caulochytrium protostelioides TaxID=1555241 RepID=A0A4P9WWM5_9FUNG|nr:hypothetical protein CAUPRSCDRAFT_11733 [Caulochytrium protostelioides]